jgi:hypothetical protein
MPGQHVPVTTLHWSFRGVLLLSSRGGTDAARNQTGIIAMRTPKAATVLALLATGCAGVFAAGAWPVAARADQGAREGTPAFVDMVTREGGGLSNGPATLVPEGDGHYHVQYQTAPGSTGLSNGPATLVPEGGGHYHVQYQTAPDGSTVGAPGNAGQ